MVTDQTIPVELELIRDFVNTEELEPAVEELPGPTELTKWLSARGLLSAGTRLTPRDHADALAVRAALRVLLLANNDEAVDTTAAAETLDQAARRARLGIRFRSDGSATLEPAAAGGRGAIGRIVALAATASRDEQWHRLKACRRRSCQWAFYDHARNRSRAWCSMAVCGNREKARAYRERHAH